ncbi:hypothetical protein AB0O42_06435 [Streptomyces sp. NPDC089922]|uniref:hypothetical protein n=1 Tax=Streptomyces sp. NPDC089922 TaxID=3155189 RepID=UPI0034427DB8
MPPSRRSGEAAGSGPGADPRVQGLALRTLTETLTRGDVFHTATAPAARYVAAVLGDPRTLAEVVDRAPQEEVDLGPQTPFELRVGLLAWLGDSTVEALRQRSRPYGDAEDLEAFLDLAPELYEAVRPHLDGGSPAAREAALGAVLPLLRLNALADRRAGLRDTLLRAAFGDGPLRLRAVDTLHSWGEDVSAFL